MNFKEFMIEHEGLRHKPYTDTEGVITIGIGFNLDIGLDDEEIDMIFQRRAMKAERDAINAIGARIWARMNRERQWVLKSMAFQLGGSGLSKFKKMIAALNVEDYHTAAEEALNSKWARQTPNRAKHHSEVIRAGKI